MNQSPTRAMTSAIIFALSITLLMSCSVETTQTSDVVQPSAQLSSRILTQATFGPTSEEISRLQNMGTAAWFNDQFSKPKTLHFSYVNQAQSTLAPDQSPDENMFLESFWRQAITGDDQLRQRVTYALSQILVISFQNDTLADMPRGVAHYYDTLATHAFGNYRDLLQAVSLHPTMGIYLSALKNQKTVGARVPDENYAREIMQLFTIGLRKLNVDGTDTTNPATPTYNNDDIKGLAKVFTGWSWAGPDKNSNRFMGYDNPKPDPNRDWLPMQNYPDYHEAVYDAAPAIPKSVLLSDTVNGAIIPQNTSGEDSLKIALDKLFNHPNVGPFIGRQLIQRMVTSNPSPAYIGRVAAAFNNNGQGVRGDMKAVIKAILLDDEAKDPSIKPSYIANNNGKLREPVLRLANWMRAFHVSSASGNFKLPNTDDPLRALSQTPMRSPSVFNFFRPEYQPPNTSITTANLNAPEMQITEETSVFGYLDYMRNAIPSGIGTGREIKADYTVELSLSKSPDLLIDRIKLLLLQDNMSASLRSQILAAVSSNSNISAANKVYLAIFLTMASPEYLAQK